jgi:hypothetical protein
MVPFTDGNVQHRSCVEIELVLENFVLRQHKFVLFQRFSIQNLSFRTAKISTQARFQHKSNFEHKSFKSVGQGMHFSPMAHWYPYSTEAL